MDRKKWRRGNTSDVESEAFFDSLTEEFRYLRNRKAEKRFFNSKAFKVEFSLLPGERIFYLSYQDVKYAVLKALFILIIPMAILIGTFLAVSLFITSLDMSSIMRLVFLIVGVVIFLILGLVVGLNAASALSYRYLVTNKRIVVGFTFGQRWIRTFNFSNVLDLIVTQGPVARLFNTGTVALITGSSEGVIPTSAGATGPVMGKNQRLGGALLNGFKGIKHPFQVKSLILRLMRYYDRTNMEQPDLPYPPMERPELRYPEHIDLLPGEDVFNSYYMKRISSVVSLCCLFASPVFIFAQIFFEFADSLELMLNMIFVLLGIVVFGLVFAVIASKYHARGHEFLVTSHRVIMFKKFLSITCRDVIMGKITEVQVHQMMTGRAANFGTIKIGTKGFENVGKFGSLLSIQGVADAPREKEAIMDIILHFQGGKLCQPFMEMYDPEFFSN